ncbi:MAG: hypothetical protein P8X90_20640 [Desulfobacterales bacterium]
MQNDHNSLILGIDLGGTKILTALTDEQGRMHARDHSICIFGRDLRPGKIVRNSGVLGAAAFAHESFKSGR